MAGRAPTTVTILFCDLVGSTELIARLDDRADATRRAMFDALRHALRPFRGEEVKSLGDGLMVVFPSAADGLRAAVAMEQAMDRLSRRDRAAPLRLRVGLSVGDTTAEDDDYFGPAVVEAARLCQAAAPGQVLASQVVLTVAGHPGSITARCLGPQALKGMSEPTTVCELVWSPAEGPVPLHPALERSSRAPMVGRIDDLACLAAVVEAAGNGQRTTSLVAGEPGIGKTRLMAAVASSMHAQGVVTLYASCQAELGDAYYPFAGPLRLLVEICDDSVLDAHVREHGGELARLVPELAVRVPDLPMPRVGEPEGDRLRLFDAVDHFLSTVSTEQPVMLVIDDLHWATRPTVLLLGHLSRSLRPASLALVATYRDTEIDAGHPIIPMLADLRRVTGVAWLRLAGLDQDDVVELLEQRAGRTLGPRGRTLAQVIHGGTLGNAFFVRELVDHLVDTGVIEDDEPDLASSEALVPDSLRDFVRGRLSRLSPATCELLSIAAVVGVDFTVEVVVEAGRADGPLAGDSVVEALSEALRERLVVEASELGTAYAFAHALVRRVIFIDLGSPRRAELHRRVGEALERLRGTEGPHVAILAHHFTRAVAAGAGDQAARYAVAAARRALDQVAYEQASDTLEAALAALDAGGRIDFSSRCDLLLALAETRVRTFDHEGVREAGLRAAEAARHAGSPRKLAEAAAWYSARAVAGEHNARGIALCEEALATLAPGDRRERALVLAGLATQRAFAGDADLADAASREAVTLATETGDAAVQALSLFARYYTLWGSEHAAEQLGLANQLRSFEVVLPTGLLASLDAQRLRAFPHLALGRREEFLDTVAAISRIGEETRSPYFRAAACMWQGCQRLLEGRFDEFDTTVGATSALVGDDPNFRNAISAQTFHRHFEGGRLGDLAPMMAEFANRAPGLVGFRAALALALAEAGRADEARSIFEEIADDDFGAVSRDLVWPVTLAVLAEVSVSLADGHRAKALYNLLRPYSGQLVVLSAAYCPGAADRYLGMLAMLNGDCVEADALYRSAAELEARMGARPLLARTHMWHARMLDTRARPGDRDRARELAHEALATAEELGMTRVAGQARTVATRA